MAWTKLFSNNVILFIENKKNETFFVFRSGKKVFRVVQGQLIFMTKCIRKERTVVINQPRTVLHLIALMLISDITIWKKPVAKKIMPFLAVERTVENKLSYDVEKNCTSSF